MAKAKRPRDAEDESVRESPRRLDPAHLKKRMAFWRGEIGRVGRSDRKGGVFRLPGYDHDGRSISREEEDALDRMAAVEESEENI